MLDLGAIFYTIVEWTSYTVEINFAAVLKVICQKYASQPMWSLLGLATAILWCWHMTKSFLYPSYSGWMLTDQCLILVTSFNFDYLTEALMPKYYQILNFNTWIVEGYIYSKMGKISIYPKLVYNLLIPLLSAWYIQLVSLPKCISDSSIRFLIMPCFAAFFF